MTRRLALVLEDRSIRIDKSEFMEPETGPKTTGSEPVEERREQGTKNKAGRCVRRCKTMVRNWLLELGGQAPGVGDSIMQCFQRRGCISAAQDASVERNSMARQCSSGHAPTSSLSHLSITQRLIPVPLPSCWMSAQAQSPCPLSNLVPL